MREAIKDAKKNKHHFGAVIVKGNKIISKAGKRPEGGPRYLSVLKGVSIQSLCLDLKDCILGGIISNNALSSDNTLVKPLSLG